MERLADTGSDEQAPEREPAAPETTCEGCGVTVVGLVLMGRAIPLRFCPACVGVELAAQEAEERLRHLDQALALAGRTNHLRDLTIATHPLAAAREVAESWLERYREGQRRNLWLHGPVASGKTGLAWGIVRALTEDAVAEHFGVPLDERRFDAPPRRALLLVWRDLYDDLVASFGAVREMNHEAVADPKRLLSVAKRIPVLALDDLGAGREKPTPYALEQLEILVDRRYQEDLTTIVTSNLSTRELAAQLGQENPIAGERIVTRLIEGAVGLRFEDAKLRRAAR